MDPVKTLDRLNNLLRHCQKSVPFYRDRLSAAPLQSLKDFRNLPLTRKADLWEHDPLGMVAVPEVELSQYHESAGTTGRPVSVWLTREDLTADATALSAWGAGFQSTDLVMVRFPYSISGVAPAVTAAAQQRGACVIPAGNRSAVTPFPRVVNLLRKLRATVLACLPLQALLIGETAMAMGLAPGKDFPDLRAICVTGETLAPGRRKTVADLWGVPVFAAYYGTEFGTAAMDCPAQRSHPLDEHFFFEILRNDLVTPAAPDEIGNLVLTTFKRRGTPLIRYLTEDRARLIPGRCACGAAVSLEIRGRATEVLPFQHRTLDLWDVQEIVAQLPSQRFWVAASHRDILDLTIESEGDKARIGPAALQPLEKACGVKIRTREVPPGTLYNREALLSVGVVGKPQYIYSAAEMAAEKYLNSARI